MMRVRRAAPEDAGFIAATYRPFVEDHWTSFETEAPDADEIARRMAAAGDAYPWLIAENEAGHPLGYAYGTRHRARAAYQTSVETAIYMAEPARGTGAGKRLYTALLERLAAQNFIMAFAGVALPNPASQALHEACGFARIGLFPSIAFKHGAWRDTEWWARPLAEPSSPPATLKTVPGDEETSP